MEQELGRSLLGGGALGEESRVDEIEGIRYSRRKHRAEEGQIYANWKGSPRSRQDKRNEIYIWL